MNTDFLQLSHTADIKIRVFGSTLEFLFVNALSGMFHITNPIIPECLIKNNRILCPKLPKKHEINLYSFDKNTLLVDFLSESLCLSDIYNEAYFNANIKILKENHIHAIIYGVSIKGFQSSEIKAVTYHDLEIKKTISGWQVDIIFDI